MTTFELTFVATYQFYLAMMLLGLILAGVWKAVSIIFY